MYLTGTKRCLAGVRHEGWWGALVGTVFLSTIHRAQNYTGLHVFYTVIGEARSNAWMNVGF